MGHQESENSPEITSKCEHGRFYAESTVWSGFEGHGSRKEYNPDGEKQAWIRQGISQKQQVSFGCCVENTARWAGVIKPEDSPQCQNVAFRFPFAEETFKRFMYKGGT